MKRNDLHFDLYISYDNSASMAPLTNEANELEGMYH